MFLDKINQIEFYLSNHKLVLVLLMVWMIAWKGIALWKAAGLSQKSWFVILLIVNTFGILEIIYIYAVANRKKREISSSQM